MGDYRLRGYLVFESTLRTMVSDVWNEPWSVGPVDRPEGQSGEGAPARIPRDGHRRRSLPDRRRPLTLGE